MNPRNGGALSSTCSDTRVAPGPCGASMVRTLMDSGPPEPVIASSVGGRSSTTVPVISAFPVPGPRRRRIRAPVTSAGSSSSASATSGSQRRRSSTRVATRKTSSIAYGSSMVAETLPMASYATGPWPSCAATADRPFAACPSFRAMKSRARAARASRPASTRPLTESAG